MFSLIKESICLTNKNIAIATPLILFTIILNLYIAVSSNGNFLGLLFAVILLFFMFGAFFSGWFYMIKQAVKDENKIQNNLSDFPTGVGEYFLPVCGLMIISTFFLIITTTIATIIGIKTIGNVNINPVDLHKASETINDMNNFLLSIPRSELLKLSMWNILLFCSAIISYFAMIFYIPALFFKTKNPLKAFIYGVKDLFCRKFFKTLLLFILIFSVYFVLSIISVLLNPNLIGQFLMTIIYFYFIVFAGITLFNYYYSNFIKIGSKIDTTV